MVAVEGLHPFQALIGYSTCYVAAKPSLRAKACLLILVEPEAGWRAVLPCRFFQIINRIQHFLNWKQQILRLAR